MTKGQKVSESLSRHWAENKEYREYHIKRLRDLQPVRTATYRRKRDAVWVGLFDDELRKLLVDRTSLRMMERRLGFSRSTIQKRMRDLGISS